MAENKDEETGIMPTYNVPNIQMLERLTPDGSQVTLLVNDLRGFIDSLISLKPGDQKDFIRYGERTTVLKIVNFDSSIKKL